MDFGFIGRCSTEDQQDPESSRAWQINRAKTLIEPHGGVIVKEYFDVAHSRALPWQRRPEASALLADLREPDRGFDDVVIGEPHRAFYGNQFGLTFPLFTHYGVRLWVPEVGGPLDPDNEAHDLVMSVFGGMSKGERNRIKVRVRTAMAAQTQLEGRYLGGRPPYGYRLKELGPHPNPAKAADGRRLHGLEPDPVTAPVVGRIFALFLDGWGLFLIAETLTADGILCPSAYDRARNPHRSGVAWSKSAVRVILTNPRYTGRQVWNRQRTDEVLLDVDDVAMGHTSVMRWNGPGRWVRSSEVVHEPLVDEATFEAAQRLLAVRGSTRGGEHRRHAARRPYVLRGLLRCGVCERRMQAQHSHGVAYYRCRYPLEYALANTVEHPRSVILREDSLVQPLDGWLASLFAPSQRVLTERAMVDSQPVELEGPNRAVAQRAIDECDGKLARHRAALEAGADPAVVTSWIAETQRERARAAALLAGAGAARPPARRLSADEIHEMVDQLGDIVSALAEADPADKTEVYRQLGLRLTYQPETKTVRAEVDPGEHRWGKVCVRGGT